MDTVSPFMIFSGSHVRDDEPHEETVSGELPAAGASLATGPINKNEKQYTETVFGCRRIARTNPHQQRGEAAQNDSCRLQASCCEKDFDDSIYMSEGR